MDIAAWLKDLGLERYADAFHENNVDPQILPKLTSDDLKEIGVIAVGDRRRLLDAIASLGDAAAASILTKRSSSEAERRQLTVMFADLAGSTELATRLDPEDLGALMRTYQEHCARVIESWAGHVAKYMGDGVLAYFGWPRAHEDDPERAVRAGLALTEAISTLRAPSGDHLAARVGIATGLVMVGDLIGDGAAQESAVVGDTPNLAARLQGRASAGAVVVAPSTRRLLCGVFDLQDLGEHALKGFAKPIQAWRVAGEAVSESRFQARAQCVAPLVGRDDEAEIVMRRWRRAREGEGQVVLITGEAGIGKSRLAATLVEEVAHEPHGRLTYQCSPHHTASAFHPVVRQLEHAASIRSGQEPDEKLERLEALLSTGASARQLPLLAMLLSIPLDPAPTYGAQELRERTFRALLELLEDLATAHPVLMVFEDVHWADPSTLELVDRLVERVDSLPVMVLITARTGFAAPWSDQAHVACVALSRIGRHESRALCEALAGEDSVAEDLIESITTRSDGIPLFLEEMTRAVLEGERTADGRAEVPASLQDSLMARLDRLQMAKPVAQMASALGRDFTSDLLEPVCRLPRADLDRALDELVEAGLLIQRGAASRASYVFKHALVQEAAYGSLLRGNRKELHRRIAETLGGHLANQPAMLAHHWESAADLDQALTFRVQAAELATARSARWEAVAHYWHVLDLLERLPETENTRRQHLATLLALSGLGSDFWQNEADRTRARRYVERAIEIANKDDNAAALARLKAFYCDHFELDAPHKASLADEAIQHAIDTGEQRVRAEVEGCVAGYHGQQGRFEESIGYVDRSIEIYGGLGAKIELGLVLATVGRCYLARAGRLDRSLNLAGQARDLADATGDLYLSSWLAMEAEPYFYKGLWQSTIDAVDQWLPAALEVGNWAAIGWASGWAAIAEVKLGSFRAARDRIETAFKRVGARAPRPFLRAYPLIALGHVRLANGELAAATDAAQEAVAMADFAKASMERGAAHRLLGQIYAARGDLPAAEAAHRESLDTLRSIQSRPELAQSLLAYGRFRRADDPAEGDRLLADALDLFEGMDASGWVEETRAALEA